ncbi:MAG: EAL domain-containing protein [Salinisphaera sp.]|jgi:diguanylate cyclase (GGDEF)-like protein/PAS domain S-box-containing protein|nr:EAL domain-containing protein [Salinisphaera sp.]
MKLPSFTGRYFSTTAIVGALVQLAVLIVVAILAPTVLWFVVPACVIGITLFLFIGRSSGNIRDGSHLEHVETLTPDGHDDAAALAQWIESIDLSAVLPNPLDGSGRPDTALALAVDRLVGRIRDYRDRLLVRHQRVQRLLRNVTDVLLTADHDGNITWITDSSVDMLGYAPGELVGHSLSKLFVESGSDLALLLNNDQLKRSPIRARRKDGSTAWLMVSSRRIDDADGKLASVECICRDGTRLIQTQQALNREKERAQVALNAIGDGVITTDAHGIVDYLNPRALDMLGTTADTATGSHFDSLCLLVDGRGGEPLTGMIDDCLSHDDTRTWEDNLTLVHGVARHPGPAVKITISPIHDEQQAAVGTVVALHDITRLQQISDEMSYQANHDLITGLPNRRAFEARLTHIQAHAASSEKEHALCYIDLDQFKLVNDTCGHDAGDEMLRQIANMLRNRLRSGDIIARLGGDEFGVIMENLPTHTARKKAEKIRADIDMFRFRWQDKLFRLGASIGLAAIDSDAVSVTELLRRADTACYQAKEKGRNQVHIYCGNSDETQTRHGDMQRMQQISDALDNDRFSLYAQIIAPLDPGHNHRLGAELLLRVRDTDGTILSPQNFLITAERYHAAVRIDRWVLARALKLIEEVDHHDGRIDHYSINMSGQSITDEGFIDFAMHCIENSAVDPTRLVFEITETTAVTNTLRAGELIRSLRALGCRFSLDDFGSGLSSFSYLKDLPSDFIKIDGKLVRAILRDPIEASIVQAINQVGQAMGLRTVAEQVESAAVLDALRRIGIDYAQGYHVARPVPFEDLAALLDQREQNTLSA